MRLTRGALGRMTGGPAWRLARAIDQAWPRGLGPVAALEPGLALLGERAQGDRGGPPMIGVRLAGVGLGLARCGPSRYQLPRELQLGLPLPAGQAGDVAVETTVERDEESFGRVVVARWW
jgi:hypothetical protein